MSLGVGDLGVARLRLFLFSVALALKRDTTTIWLRRICFAHVSNRLGESLRWASSSRMVPDVIMVFLHVKFGRCVESLRPDQIDQIEQ